MSILNCDRQSQFRQRQGIVLIVVLVCLFVVSLLTVTQIRSLLMHRRQTRTQGLQIQAFWLAESAAQRARAKLKESPDYQGETWKVGAEKLGDDLPGVAVIRVERASDEKNFRVRVEAIYPDDPIHRVQVMKQFVVELSASGGGSR